LAVQYFVSFYCFIIVHYLIRILDWRESWANS
jgi:hypothetical protein